MRVLIAISCFATAFLPALARAEQIDLNAETCKDFMQSGKESIGYTLAWLDGYYKDDNDPPIIDFDKLKDNADKLHSYCAAHRETSLGDAAEELFGK